MILRKVNVQTCTPELPQTVLALKSVLTWLQAEAILFALRFLHLMHRENATFAVSVGRRWIADHDQRKHLPVELYCCLYVFSKTCG